MPNERKNPQGWAAFLGKSIKSSHNTLVIGAGVVVALVELARLLLRENLITAVDAVVVAAAFAFLSLLFHLKSRESESRHREIIALMKEKHLIEMKLESTLAKVEEAEQMVAKEREAKENIAGCFTDLAQSESAFNALALNAVIQAVSELHEGQSVRVTSSQGK
jgi:hypothetical protein